MFPDTGLLFVFLFFLTRQIIKITDKITSKAIIINGEEQQKNEKNNAESVTWMHRLSPFISFPLIQNKNFV